MLNPETSRPCKIGGKVYKDLVKRGIIKPMLGENIKPVENEDKPKSSSIDSKRMAKISAETLTKNISHLANMEVDDIQGELERLIIDQIEGRESKPYKKPVGRPRKSQKKSVKYKTRQISSSEESESDESE